MNTAHTELLALCFQLPESVSIQTLDATPTMVTMYAAGCQLTGLCPQCQQTSDRIHSHYERRIADVPCGRRQVRLLLTVRTFICHTSVCAQHIFTERFPDFVLPYARHTNRLREVLEAIGLATCGEAGSRLTSKLGIQVSPSTLLRYIRAVHISPVFEEVHVLGVDDWAWKKGQTYGTILVDLERHRVIGLLPDREAETLGNWLRIHPEIEIVSRDRATAYAEAIKQHAPQARQVADRFHLLKNLREKLKEVIEHHHTSLPSMEERRDDGIPQTAQGQIPQSESPSLMSEMVPSPTSKKVPPTANFLGSPPQRAVEQRKQKRRARRIALYEEIRTLRMGGHSYQTIADTLGICPRTVRRFVMAEDYPDLNPWPRRGSMLDPYKPYLLQQVQAEQHHTGSQLYSEI